MSARRLLALLCVCLVGVLVAVALVVHALAGPVGAAVYGALALVLVGAGVVRGRRLLAPRRLPAGRTCTCCTTTHSDPVKVI